MKKVFLLVFLFLIFLSEQVYAKELTYDELLEKINHKDEEIFDLKFDFIQETEIKLTKEKQKIYGHAVYKKPDKLYLEIEPFKQIVVSDGKKVWLYTPQYNQVIVETWAGLSKWERYGFVPKEIFNFVDSVKKLEKKYQLEYLGYKDDFYSLRLVPRNMSNIQIQVWISTSTWLPEKTELFSETINITNQVEKIEVNTKPDDKIFRFKPPEGVEILSSPFK